MIRVRSGGSAWSPGVLQGPLLGSARGTAVPGYPTDVQPRVTKRWGSHHGGSHHAMAAATGARTSPPANAS